MTYAEYRYATPFDWEKFINSNATTIEWYNAYVKSLNWVTCACGQQCIVIPRKVDPPGCPVDLDLAEYGCEFTTAIHNCWIASYQNTDLQTCRNKALLILHKIEKRSAEIIQEVYAI